MIQENRDRHDEIARRLQDPVRLQAALKKAARDAVQQHALAGRKIAVWRDGQVVWEEASNSTVETLAVERRQVLTNAGAESREEEMPAAIELLRKPGLQDRRKGVVLAETLRLKGELRDELREHLRNFIEEHRESNNPEDLVAVGSAIRKLVAMSDIDDLGYAATILKPSPRMSVPIDVELEVTKMIVRKLVANSGTLIPTRDELADLLYQIVEVYTNERMLPRDKYGATALNAILGSVLLQSRHIDSIRRILGRLSAQWFVLATARRCRKLERELASQGRPEAFPLIDALKKFEESLSAAAKS